MSRHYDVMFSTPSGEHVTFRGQGNTRRVAERSARSRLRAAGYDPTTAGMLRIDPSDMTLDDALVEPKIGRFTHNVAVLRDDGWRGLMSMTAGERFDRIIVQLRPTDLRSAKTMEWIRDALLCRLKLPSCSLIIEVAK